MTVAESTARQLLREYFEDYGSDDRFLYSFGGEQFFIIETPLGNGGVSKSVIIDLFNEYFNGYKTTASFIIDMERCHFLIALQTASVRKLPEGQKQIISEEVSDDYKFD